MCTMTPSEYFEIAVKHAGNPHALSKRSGVSSQVIYKKLKENYPLGSDMFTRYHLAIAIEIGVDGLVTADNLCQKTARCKQNTHK